jgi:diguanylate cyclase (GGDEF)-like protein
MLPLRLHVLLVEDNPGDARLLREMLTPDEYFSASYAVTHVTSMQAAAQCCSDEHYDVILLDLNLSDSTGISTVQHLNNLVPHTPIVILTGVHDERLAIESAQHGAQDYIIKNDCSAPLLKRIMHYAMERKAVEKRFRHLATHDPLTGLPNRILLYDRLSQALHRAQRNQSGISAKWKATVMLMDLDNFKTLNDTLGHALGDAVLQLAAQRMTACLRKSDTVARLGGDEFIIVIEGISSKADCLCAGRKLLQAIGEPARLGQHDISLRASIGISIFPDDAEDMDMLIRFADAAMYYAKRQQLPLCFYNPRNFS